MKPYAGILFGYRAEPSCGFIGQDRGGFSLDIRENGTVMHRTYLFPDLEITQTRYQLAQEGVRRMHDTLCAAQAQIQRFPEHLYNGSRDGGSNRFIFNGKRIEAWNIQKYDVMDMSIHNPAYLEQYAQTIRFENAILTLFDCISGILSAYGIRLSLWDVEFDLPGETIPYWHPYADGATIGQQGTQGGIIVSDEACKGARITLEKGGAVPYAMLCAMDGTAFHTVLASDEQEAMMRYEKLKAHLVMIIQREELPPWWAERFCEEWS